MADFSKKRPIGKKASASAGPQKSPLEGLEGPFATPPAEAPAGRPAPARPSRPGAGPAAAHAHGASPHHPAPARPVTTKTTSIPAGRPVTTKTTAIPAGRPVTTKNTAIPASRPVTTKTSAIPAARAASGAGTSTSTRAIAKPVAKAEEAAPRRKGGAAKKSPATNETGHNRTSIRQSGTISQTGTGIRAPGGPRKGQGPKFSLALKFAVPVAAVVIFAFLIAGAILNRLLLGSLSQEIVKSGVAQVTMLSALGRNILVNFVDKNDPDWPEKMGLITESEAMACWHKARPDDQRPREEQKKDYARSLCLARNGALLRRFIVFANDERAEQETQTVVAYIFSNIKGGKSYYNQKAGGTGFMLASSEFPSPELEKDFASDKAASPKIVTEWSWLPTGFKFHTYTVGGKPYELGDNKFCDVYAGLVKTSDEKQIQILAFQMPIYAENGTDKVGTAVIGIDPNEVLDATAAISKILILIGCATIVFTALTCLFIGFHVVKPVEVLIDDMDAVASGNLAHKSHVSTNDEIGMLASQFNAMTVKLQGAVQTEKKIAAVESELDIAREIQRKLLPEKLPQVKGMDIFATYHPAKEVGGDYYDFFPIDATHIGIIVADVSGKGVPGSMVMGTTRTILRFVAAGNLSSADTLKRTNSMVAADIKRGMFVTAFYMVLDVAARSILCSSAGHNPMVLIHADGNYDLINPNGIALGFDKGRIFDRTIKEQPIALQSGDRVVLYTDGVVEAMNLNNEEYSDERFYTFVQSHFMHDSETFVNELLEDLNAHKCSADTRAHKAEQHDDITIVTFRVL